MLRHLFLLSGFLLIFFAAFIFLSPSLLVPDLIYPQRIDSLYIQFQKDQFLKEHRGDEVIADSLFIFNPSDLGLKYEFFNVRTIDSVMLKGWYIPADDSEAVSVLVLHDWNESKIMKLNFGKQMRDRGFDIYLIDMRAHGNSGGQIFSPALLSVEDVKAMADSILHKPSTKHLVLAGSGMSASIAIQSALLDGRFDALVAQYPVDNFEKFLKVYSLKKWGIVNKVFYPLLKRKFETVIQQSVQQFQMNYYASAIKTPSLFIGVDNDPFYSPFDSYALFEKMATEKKDLFLVGKASHESIELVGGEDYYNRISEFINSAIPKKTVKVRNKKMA